MFARSLFTVGLAALVSAAPAAAQYRGTVEFGAFASSSMYDNSYNMTDNWGGGVRLGAYLVPRLSLEFEAGAGSTSRTIVSPDVDVTVFSAGATLVPLKLGHRVSVLLGGGVDRFDASFFDSYGAHALAGLKLDLNSYVALRTDAVQTWMFDDDNSNTALRVGLSIYRHPGTRLVTTVRTVQATPVADSVSADETHRLRLSDASYRSLRDSLAQPGATMAASSAEALATMQQMVVFERSSSTLSVESKRILDAKVQIFQDNPEMRIVIMGFASQPGDSAYNMALGLRRAESAKAYLVSRGVSPVRIEIGTKGEGELLVAGPVDMDENASANVANRRNQFRLLVADPYLVAPRKTNVPTTTAPQTTPRPYAPTTTTTSPQTMPRDTTRPYTPTTTPPTTP